MGGIEVDFQMTFTVAFFSFLSGLLGSMGFGGGSILILYLTLLENVPQLSAQGINLLFFIPIAAVSVIVNTKNKLINKKAGLYMTIGGVSGLISGLILLNNINTELLGKLFGGFVLLMGIRSAFQKGNKK